jgi:hypothetical protein
MHDSKIKTISRSWVRKKQQKGLKNPKHKLRLEEGPVQLLGRPDAQLRLLNNRK